MYDQFSDMPQVKPEMAEAIIDAENNFELPDIRKRSFFMQTTISKRSMQKTITSLGPKFQRRGTLKFTGTFSASKYSQSPGLPSPAKSIQSGVSSPTFKGTNTMGTWK